MPSAAQTGSVSANVADPDTRSVFRDATKRPVAFQHQVPGHGRWPTAGGSPTAWVGTGCRSGFRNVRVGTGYRSAVQQPCDVQPTITDAEPLVGAVRADASLDQPGMTQVDDVREELVGGEFALV